MRRTLPAIAFCVLGFIGPAFAQSAGTPQFLRDCADCPEMVVLAPGQFLAGSPADEPGRHPDEPGPHQVTIARSFAIGRYEVTAAEWDACVAAQACRATNDRGNGRGRLPVIDVSWDDAQQYIVWLNTRVTGVRYRLPTENEWEYAARAQSQTRYSWGDDNPTCEAAARNGANSNVCRPSRLQPVGAYAANAFGVHDMSGNVWEWTADCYTHDDPCQWRVLRGGSWGNPVQDLRSANRAPNDPSYRSVVVGFRVARDVP